MDERQIANLLSFRRECRCAGLRTDDDTREEAKRRKSERKAPHIEVLTSQAVLLLLSLSLYLGRKSPRYAAAEDLPRNHTHKSSTSSYYFGWHITGATYYT